MIEKAVIKKIKEIIPSAGVLVGDEEKICYSYDASIKEALPDIIVKADTADEISSVIKIASEHNIPIIPRGAGTGFAGGTVPVRGGIVISVAGMNKIIEIDRKNLMAVVEPGVITGTLQKEVESLGLFYPPDPSSLDISTIGGNVATCAGGPRGVKYGVTKDYVMGLDAILPDGSLLSTGGKNIKSVAGYNLTSLMVGSEGTLALINKIILKLLPLPETTSTLFVSFKSISGATKSINDILLSGTTPSTIEFMDRFTIEIIRDHIDIEIGKDIGATLLIELDGDVEEVRRGTDKVKDILLRGGATDIVTAKDEIERKHLWDARRGISPTLRKLKPTKLNQDIAVPRASLPEMIDQLHSIAEKYNILIVNFGHAGDGNIHVNVMTDSSNIEEMGRATKAVDEIFRQTIELGGTISGEHGIGISKKDYLEMEVGKAGISVMRKIKGAIDPK
ncbi:MAG: FAD-linked oxidase C-terminal domain-containing protein, partial [Nitrospinota bacterium]